MSHKNLHALDGFPANYWQLELKIGFKISTVLVGKHSWVKMPPPLLPQVKGNNSRYLQIFPILKNSFRFFYIGKN